MAGKNKEWVHTQRCCNPLKLDKHTGTNIRHISKNILLLFPTLSPSARICNSCRKSIYAKQNNSSCGNNNTNVADVVDCIEHEKDGGMGLADDLNEPEAKKSRHTKEAAFDNLLIGLKVKFKSLPKNDPMCKSILTILPDSWTIQDICEEFGCSYRMARDSKCLKQSSGVLAISPPKKGNCLDEKTISKVIEFYESEEIGRIMPNKKDTVSINNNGIKERKQKHLLLHDVKVLHRMFKEKYPEHSLGVSKFSELRPKWCVLAGSSGTHSVCVCTIHQNVKIMIDAANLKTLTKDSETQFNTYKDCINYILCRTPTPDCHLRICSRCAGMQKFTDLALNILEKNIDQQIIFSIWQTTDRSTLVKQCLSVADFVEQLGNRLQLLIPHHFFAQAQTEFLSKKKENLEANEVLVCCDFAENYAYVAQDAAQAFHYNNDQCTVFPVVFYHRTKTGIKNENIILLSESTKHDAAAVYLMQERVIREIKKICPKVKKIYYTSDGAKQHFKNRTQMQYLMNHKLDFGVEAEWHCNATAHGKCACDGLGACLKSEATRYSLQAKPNDAILNAQSLFT